MNHAAKVAHELRASGATTFEFFKQCFVHTYPSRDPGRSNEIARDADKYNRAIANSIWPVPIPHYVHSYLDWCHRQTSVMPAQAVRLDDIYHTTQPKGYRPKLVEDSSITWPIYAHGKWTGP